MLKNEVQNMITYYGYTISPNQLETGEGFLICRNVPIARTGEQDYLGTEIGLKTNEIVKVYRPEEEVFSEAAMASFEGKPVTNNHPTEQVDPENVKLYEMGHAQNVRRGTGEFKDFLVADLHIHDAELIDAIKAGKRQISCGYECEYVERDGQIVQTNIRGNHVAVVDEGRAGVKASIMDSNTTSAEKAERKITMSKTSTLLKLFGLATNGKDSEEVTKLALDTADALEEQAEAKEELTQPEQAEVEAKVADAVSIETLNEKLDKLIELLTPKAEEKAEVEVKEDIDGAIEKLEAEASEKETDGEEAKVVAAEEMDACGKDESKDACKDSAINSATQAHILRAVRGPVAGITDPVQRQAVSDAILSAVRVKTSDMSNILAAQSTYAQERKSTNEDLQERYSARNPHNKKEA